MSKKVEEVTAIVEEVPEAPAKLSKVDLWLADTSSKVTDIASQYGHIDIVDGKTYRDCRNARIQLRKEIASIDQDRKDKTRVLEQLIANFKTNAANVLSPLSAIEADYKAQLDAWEAGIMDRRYAYVAEAYADMAPALADGLVPFERVWDTFGAEKKWLNKSTSDEKCVKDLEGIVERIAKEEATINNLDFDDDERNRARSWYFTTLDLSGAIQNIQAERDQKARLAELDAMRNAQSAPVEPEPIQEPPMPAEAPNSAVAPATVAQSAPVDVQEQEPINTYSFVFECTRSQMVSLIEFCKANGIHGHKTNA